MKTLTKAALAASMAAGALIAPGVAAPAAAQVNGVGTVDIAVAVANSQAFQAGYQQVATTYASQRTTIDERQQQRQQLVQTFDTNGDGQIDDTEAAPTQDPNNATVQQIQAIDQEVQQLQAPINRARVFVVQQVAQQFSPALEQVINEQGVQIVISPDALIFIPEAGDLTGAVVEKLNASVPSVAAVPPADWQPGERAVELYQQIQQIILMSAIQQQQQAQAAQAQGAGEPATTGR